MASRWSKRRNIHAEVDYHMNLISHQLITTAYSSDCRTNSHKQEIHGNVISIDCNIEGVCEKNMHSQFSSEINEPVENILNSCPYINPAIAVEMDEELNNYISTSELHAMSDSPDSDSTSDSELYDQELPGLQSDLAVWADEHKIAHTALKHLLEILRKQIESLPKDARTKNMSRSFCNERE
jgi:hypothetical protein